MVFVLSCFLVKQILCAREREGERRAGGGRRGEGGGRKGFGGGREEERERGWEEVKKGERGRKREGGRK